MQALSKNKRINPDEAIDLLKNADTAELMMTADKVRRERHGNRAYFVHSLNINPTNICENRCDLCAFWRESSTQDAYTLTLEQAREILEAAKSQGLTDLHIVGGITPKLGLEYYESLIRLSREILPDVLIQGMTAVEVQYLAETEGLTVEKVLKYLKEAGLGAIPGGGAEIFDASIRKKLCSEKISADQWLNVHEKAHEIGLPTNATMLFGHIESPEHLIAHMTRLRDLQDRTGGFLAFIPLPFHAQGTKIPVSNGPSGYTIARVTALSRIFLDNFPHIRVLVNYVDRKLLQVLTYAGVDDIGGTSIDERIASAAGANEDQKFHSINEMSTFLDDLGLAPILNNSIYSNVELETGFKDQADVCSVSEILDHAEAGERIGADEAVRLHDEAPFQELGRIAHLRRLKLNDPSVATFVIDRNISITNVCEAACRFCAFHAEESSEKSFLLSIDEIVEKVLDAVDHNATQIMLQGGLNPALDLDFYKDMFRAIKEQADVWLHSLTPTEILYLSRRSGLSIVKVLEELREAGLDSLPGGGAEILVDEVRERVSPNKIRADEWIDVMETAQNLGMKTTATMVYGFGETTEQRVEHLMKIRDLQDKTGGFTAFIPWSFQPNRTEIDMRTQSGVDYLRIVALARLVLDNIPHIQAGWVTEGPDVAQLALVYGADDFGGVLMEEKVVKATGISYKVSLNEVIQFIHEVGLTPVQRNTLYQQIKIF